MKMQCAEKVLFVLFMKNKHTALLK